MILFKYLLIDIFGSDFKSNNLFWFFRIEEYSGRNLFFDIISVNIKFIPKHIHS